MASDARYYRLIETFRSDVFSYLICCLVPIHDGHITVHENELVFTEYSLALFNISLYRFQSLFSIKSFVTDEIGVDVAVVFQNYLESFDVILLIIDDQDSSHSLVEDLYVDVVVIEEMSLLSFDLVCTRT